MRQSRQCVCAVETLWGLAPTLARSRLLHEPRSTRQKGKDTMDAIQIDIADAAKEHAKECALDWRNSIGTLEDRDAPLDWAQRDYAHVCGTLHDFGAFSHANMAWYMHCFTTWARVFAALELERIADRCRACEFECDTLMVQCDHCRAVAARETYAMRRLFE